MGTKIRRRQWQHKDGIPVKYSALHPDGLTFAIFPLAPDCPIELRAQIRSLTQRLADERRKARATFHQIKVYRRKLNQIIEDAARAVAAQRAA